MGGVTVAAAVYPVWLAAIGGRCYTKTTFYDPGRKLYSFWARASSPYGFPTAGELRNLILGDFPPELPEKLRFRFLNQMGFNNYADSDKNIEEYTTWILDSVAPLFSVSEIKDFRTRFRLSQVYSIDRFLAEPANQSLGKLGKAFIAAILLRCEKNETLAGDWYAKIFNYLIDTTPTNEVPILSVVTFNYDRSLERFLYQSYMGLHNSNEGRVIDLIDQTPIIHVYGSLGSIFKQPTLSQVPTIPYGEFREITKAAACINLVRANRPSNAIANIRKETANAKRIIVLDSDLIESI